MRSEWSHWVLRPVVSGGLMLAIGLTVWFACRGRHDEFATLSGHRAGVFSLALSPQGTSVASGDGEGSVRIWDVAKQRTKAVLTGHSDKVRGMAWAPDGKTIATASDDLTIRLWNAETGKQLSLLAKVPESVHALAYSSDGTTLAAAVDREVVYWNIKEGHKRKVLRGHRRTISGIAFLKGRSELVTFANDMTVRIWDLERSRQLKSMPGPAGHCYGLSISPDNKTIACVGGGRVHLYDVERRQPLDAIEPDARIICGVAFSPDGKLLAIGSQDNEIVLWDLQQNEERDRLNGHSYSVGQLAFLPGGDTLVTSSHDSSLKLWKVR